MADIVGVETIMRPVTQHGWLRRPELDTSTCDVWELPDGRLQTVGPGCSPMIVTLTRGRWA